VSLRSLIEHLRNGSVDESTLPTIRRSVLRDATRARSTWREILLDLPFDESSFDDRFGDGAWRRTVANLNGVCDMLPVRSRDRTDVDVSVLSFLGLLLVTLNGLGESSYRRSHQAAVAAVADQPPPAATHDCARTCQRLVQDKAIAELMSQVYRPDLPADEHARAHEQSKGAGTADSRRVWQDDVEGNDVVFYRHGTTSIILSGRGRMKDGAQRKFALKLILYPFLRIPRIEQATRNYKEVSPKATADDTHLTRVWASASNWILMDFVEGTALSELFVSGTRTDPQRVDLAALRRYGLAVFAALCQFDKRVNEDNHATRRVHGDLSPSNIIISGDEFAPQAHLIDIGRNYLYAHSSVAGAEGPDGAYIAPEVKGGAADDAIPDADLFSLGHLLILVGGVGTRQDHTVPDEFYARVPMIARFIEDLIEHDPANRLLLFPVADSQARQRYELLRERFLIELDAAEAAEESNRAPTDDRWARGLLAQLRHRLPEALRPLGGMPGRLRRIRKSLKNSRVPGKASATSSGSLLFWSWLSATAWAVTVSVTLTWVLRQLTYRGAPWQWGTRSVEAYQKALDPKHDQVLPIVDSWRRADYSFPDLVHNWPALLVGFTYILVGAKYYQNLFSSVSPLRVGWRAGRLTVWAAFAQFFMRVETVAACLLVLPVVLVEPRWWPIDSAIGQIVVYLCNRCVFSFSTTALDRARAAKLTSVPGTNTAITGLSNLRLILVVEVVSGWPG
jgi:hypothetical protein